MEGLKPDKKSRIEKPRFAVRAAKHYLAPDDLWVVTCYFNAARFKSKKRNYETFQNKMRASGVKCLTIECAFGQDPFTLAPSEFVLQIRCEHIMWQKERLLNIAINALPNTCKKVVWVDCDILFENEMWAVETSCLLDSFPIVQPFQCAYRLPPRFLSYKGDGTKYDGFAAKTTANADTLFGADFEKHGHTGFAWAARRDILQSHGLYDRCIAGTGDHLMSHAFLGDLTSKCVNRIVGTDNPYYESFVTWASKLHTEVKGRIGFTKGSVLHLWHGDLQNRKYWDRNKELLAFQFDPENDLKIDSKGVFAWGSNKLDLHKWANDYFYERKEDLKSLGYGGY